jgi:hypothetical protein
MFDYAMFSWRAAAGALVVFAIVSLFAVLYERRP